MKYSKGLSSKRGRALHLIDHEPDPATGEAALCGAPVRITTKLPKLEVCDHCQHARRRRSGK